MRGFSIGILAVTALVLNSVFCATSKDFGLLDTALTIVGILGAGIFALYSFSKSEYAYVPPRFFLGLKYIIVDGPKKIRRGKSRITISLLPGQNITLDIKITEYRELNFSNTECEITFNLWPRKYSCEVRYNFDSKLGTMKVVEVNA